MSSEIKPTIDNTNSPNRKIYIMPTDNLSLNDANDIIEKLIENYTTEIENYTTEIKFDDTTGLFYVDSSKGYWFPSNDKNDGDITITEDGTIITTHIKNI